MSGEKKTLELDKYEYGVIFHALKDERNQMIKEGRPSDAVDDVILSRLVDTFSSRILYPMLLLSGNHSIAAVLSWEEGLH